MIPHSARIKISRRSWLLAGLTASLFRARAAVNLTVRFDGDNLHVAAPQLHFLTGKPLNRLQDGSTVVFVSQLTLLREDRLTVFRRSAERLTLSYDVWEEKFRVTLGTDGRSVSGLSSATAEAWCLDNLAISALGMAADRPFWLRLELREADPRELSSVVGDSGISLTSMIELFSRKSRTDRAHWTLDAGPLRLADLRLGTGRKAQKG